MLVNGDTLDEANDTYTLNLSNATNATILDASGTGTINDDDPLPSLSIDDVTVTEGDSGSVTATFTVTLSTISGRTVSVDYAAANGTATAPGDYLGTGGTLIFAAGETTKTVTVQVNGDTLDEANESYFVNLSNPSNATVTDGQGLGTINDDDPMPSLVIDDVSVTEGDAGTTNANFTVSLSSLSGQSVTVDFATANGTAIAPGDYTARTGTLTFTAGQLTRTITVAVNPDTIDEVNETYFLNLSNATNATIADNQGVGTIIDDDGLPSLSVNDVTVVEGQSGTVNANFTVSLSAPSGQSVSIGWTAADGTATSPADYMGGGGNIVFNPGITTRTLTVVVNSDTLDEIDENFTVHLTDPNNATIADDIGLGTITDDDAPPGLSVNDVTVTEGDAGTVNAVFTVTLSPVSGRAVSVNWATANGSAVSPADYEAIGGQLSFAAGETAKQVAVTVNADLLDEANETFLVNLSGPTNATITDGQGIGTITDNDPLPTLAVDDVTVTELDSGTVGATFTVSLNAPSGREVNVNYATANGSASSPSDYESAIGALTFNAGQTTKTVTVVVHSDVLDEADETFFFNLAGPTNATLADGQGLGTITDNDPTPTLSVNDVTVLEGNTGTVPATFTVTLSASSGRAVTVDYATANDSAAAPGDYAATSGGLTFNPGETTRTVTVNVNGDLLNEVTERFFLNLTNPTNAGLPDGQAFGTITDDDGTPAISINDVTVGESNASGASFSVNLSSASGQTVTVDYATANGTAISPADYTAGNDTVTFSPGQTSRTVTVPVVNDLLDEDDETFLVNLTNAQHATIGDPQATGTITDNDGLPALSVNDVTVDEGNSGTVTATFTVSLNVPERAECDRRLRDRRRIGAGAGRLPGGDRPAHLHAWTDDEDGQRDGQRRSPRRGERDVLSQSLERGQRDALRRFGVGTITDDDATPTLSVDDVTVLEGDTGTVPAIFTVSLSAPSGRAVSVAYATANNTANAPADYLAANGTLNFAAGETTKTVTVTVNGEDLNEVNETYFLNLTTPTNATLADGQGLGTITDDDGQPELTINDPAVSETGPNANFTVTLSASSGQTVTVDYATVNGTATARRRLHGGQPDAHLHARPDHEDSPRAGAERHARRERRNVLGQPVQRRERDDHRRPGHGDDHRQRRAPDALDR